MMNWLYEYAYSDRIMLMLNQTVVIVAIFLLGFLLILSSVDGCDDKISYNRGKRMALAMAFPAGVSLFVITGFVLLLLGIPYRCEIITTILLVIAICLFLGMKKKGRHYYNRRELLSILAVVLVLALVSASGLIHMSVSNDSLYYFWQYPRAIVSYQGLRDQFDNFLTDTGLGAAIIGTIPFLYGFLESFGIQEFFHLSFLFTVFNEIYDEMTIDRNMPSKRGAMIISVVAMLLTASITPVFILSHWAMANMYFMELFVMIICLFRYMGRKENAKGLFFLMSIMIFACSQIRMEGGIFIIVLVVMLGIYENNVKKLSGSLCLVVLLQTAMEMKIFLGYNIDNPYTFMTRGKALIQLSGYIVVIAYILIMDRMKLEKLKKYQAPMIIAALSAINLLLLVYDRAHYIANIKAFVLNMLGQSGWGILPYVIVCSIVVIIVYCMIERNKGGVKFSAGSSFWLFMTLGFCLVTIAVSFARGDNLNVDTGDSGNRVLLQVAPLIVITLVDIFVDICEKSDNFD